MKKIKRLSLLFIACTLTLASMTGGLTYADTVTVNSNIVETTIENAGNQLNDEAKAFMLGYALAQCMAGGTRNASVLDAGVEYTDLFNTGNNSIFDTAFNSNPEAYVGKTVGASLGFNTDSYGRIDCLDYDLITMFTNALNNGDTSESRRYTQRDLICGRDGNGGLFVGKSRYNDDLVSCINPRYQDDLGVWHDTVYVRNGSPGGSYADSLIESLAYFNLVEFDGCRNSTSNYNVLKACSELDWDLYWMDDINNPGLGWLQTIASYFDEAAETYGWKTRFIQSLGNNANTDYFTVPSYLFYYVERKEAMGSCGVYSFKDWEENITSPNLKNITPDYQNDTSHLSRRAKLEFTQTSGKDVRSVFRRDHHTGCADIISQLNQKSESFNDYMKEKLNTNCKGGVDTIVEELGGFDNLTAVSQNKVRLARSSRTPYEIGYYIEAVEGDENKGWQCMSSLENKDGQSGVINVDDLDVDPILSPEGGTTDVNCYTNAGALGWILCPVVEQGGQFVEFIYDKFIEPQLVLDSGIFSQNNAGGQETFQAWGTFRDLANIAFVAVFLFVILSQLTGYGIDNYGIKKILPKLIITAIIVNISYFICQIAIDAANIIGYGIKNVMSGIGAVPPGSEFAIHEGGHTLASIGSTVGLTGLVAALVAPAVLGQGIGILVSVFTAVIGIVVAILTLFVVLAARKALAVCLVVISPLAFLCYMLPNTKKLFDKWLNALKATLIAFPICAGMVFGGQAVGRLIMLTSNQTSGTFFLTLIAAVTSVAPIFLIPSTLKKSMGAISGIIDKASHGVNRFAKGRWQGSKTAKNMKESGASWANRRASGLKIDKDGNISFSKRGELQNRFHKKGSAAARRIQAQRDAVLAENAASIISGDRFGDENYLQNKQAGIRADAAKKRVSDIEAYYRLNKSDTLKQNGVGGAFENELLAAMNAGDEDRIKALTNIATTQGDPGRTLIRNAAARADSATGKQMLAEHIMDNYAGTFKENARWMYEWANQNQRNGRGPSVEEAMNLVKSGNLRGAQINNMDDGDFDLVKEKAVAAQQAFNASQTAVENAGGYDNLAENDARRVAYDNAKKEYDNVFGALYAAQRDQSFTGAKVARRNDIDNLVSSVNYKPDDVAKAEAAAQAKADAAAQAEADAKKAQTDAFQAQADAINELARKINQSNGPSREDKYGPYKPGGNF